MIRFRWLLSAIACASVAAGCGESEKPKELTGVAKQLAETLTRVDFCPTWSPDGKRLLYPSRARPVIEDSPFSVNGGILTVIDADGTNRQELPNRILGDNPDWSPDGKRIVFSREEPGLNQGTGELDAVSPDGTGRKSIVASHMPDAYNSYPKWSPDSRQLAYLHTEFTFSDETALGVTGERWLAVVNADGSAPRRLTGAVFGSPDDPDWAPDGRRLVFSNGPGLVIAYLDGTEVRRIVQDVDAELAFGPSWSPDGQRIAFERGGNLFIVDATNGTTTSLTAISETGASDACPEWSPDGSRIAFLRTIERQKGTPKTFDTPKDATSSWSAVFVINSDGTGEHQVTQRATSTP